MEKKALKLFLFSSSDRAGFHEDYPVNSSKRLADLMGPEGGVPVSTAGMGDAILKALDATL